MLYVPPQGTVALASHEPEEVYAVLEGAGTMHFTKGPQAIKKGDFIYLPAWCEHSIDNTGVEQMVVMVITSPPNPWVVGGIMTPVFILFWISNFIVIFRHWHFHVVLVASICWHRKGWHEEYEDEIWATFQSSEF